MMHGLEGYIGVILFRRIVLFETISRHPSGLGTTRDEHEWRRCSDPDSMAVVAVQLLGVRESMSP